MTAPPLAPKPAAWPDADLVEGYGDRAVERWQRTGIYRGGRRRHSPSICPCLVCADGRELMGMTAFRPSWRSVVGAVAL